MAEVFDLKEKIGQLAASNHFKRKLENLTPEQLVKTVGVATLHAEALKIAVEWILNHGPQHGIQVENPRESAHAFAKQLLVDAASSYDSYVEEHRQFLPKSD